jgi:hypothetical protein
MPATIARPVKVPRAARGVTPSIVDPRTATPFTLEQELKPFGAWIGNPIWVPPKDASGEMAETMLRQSRPFASREKRWNTVVEMHRADFTQVRELDLFEASIRLPKGKFFVTVTEEKDFDKITEPIPNCVQTRLDEFLSGPHKQRGAKVYYLKPLCVELGDDLIMTTGDDLTAAILKIQAEVFAAYRRKALYGRPLQAMVAAANLSLALPRAAIKYAVARRQKAIDALHARLEFERRKLALKAAQTHNRRRSNTCTFDDMLELTSPLDRVEVIEQYCVEQELSAAQRQQLLRLAAGTVPWFVALSLTAYTAMSIALMLTMTVPPVAVCDPAFVAELPGSRGVILKIGHFDEVGGITHVEI